MKALDANGGRLTVGRTASLAEVGIPTMRFYERAGLLPKPTRTASNYRLYSDDRCDSSHVRHPGVVGDVAVANKPFLLAASRGDDKFTDSSRGLAGRFGGDHAKLDRLYFQVNVEPGPKAGQKCGII